MTAGERIGVLDAQLDASLAVFDGMILTERSAVQVLSDSAPQGDEESASGNGTGDMAGGEPLFEEADLDEPAGIGSPAGESGVSGSTGNGESGDTENTTVAARSGKPGLYGSGKEDGTVPPDLRDASDDDIVARQIREAAMAETDPVLREKLWDEYRKYKKGQ
ncbi:MAG: hypothetical protein CMK32_05670 [Porticoccaceae bacterium]|nr:hypothetical protein [Porticoccaceae bacterium]